MPPAPAGPAGSAVPAGRKQAMQHLIVTYGYLAVFVLPAQGHLAVAHGEE
jgi:hypothetical protein